MADDNSLVPAQRKRSRRTFSKAFKAELVALALAGEKSVAQIAMDHRINANQLRKWMTLAKDGVGGPALVPVRVSPQRDHSPAGNAPAGRLALEVALPYATLRFHRPLDAGNVAALLKALR